jgi:hypothetical protein
VVAKYLRALTLEAFLEQLQLQPGKLANRGAVGDTASLQALLPLAIPPAKKELQKLRLNKQSKLSERLLKQLDYMNALKRRHVEQLEIDFGDIPQLKHRRDDRRSHIERVFEDHLDWLQNTQTTEEEPFIQVAAVFTGLSA